MPLSCSHTLINKIVHQTSESKNFHLKNCLLLFKLKFNFYRNVVKAFYTAGMIYDVLLTFGEHSDESQKNSKYAKWKAAYIHNCLKNGETPIPGTSIISC